MGLRVIPASRYLIIVAVIGSFMLAVTLIVYAGALAVQLLWKTIAARSISLA